MFRVLFLRPKMLFTNPLLIYLWKTLDHGYYYFKKEEDAVYTTIVKKVWSCLNLVFESEWRLPENLVISRLELVKFYFFLGRDGFSVYCFQQLKRILSKNNNLISFLYTP